MSKSEAYALQYAMGRIWATAVTDQALLNASGLDELVAGQAMLARSIGMIGGFDETECRLIALEVGDLIIAKQRAGMSRHERRVAEVILRNAGESND